MEDNLFFNDDDEFQSGGADTIYLFKTRLKTFRLDKAYN